ncbi:NAD(P)/FAD-dependent oxidoreductase [Pseudomaricurvus alkylphenolicus]|jgi:NADH dehydrogenase|uniref:NAD(P)/FAD-dependent oxidoreductase n=1 Tax=Pseudomaricurvus alkylphenolicus TaxID=1306991 RepID=UPI00141F0707|nr:NAD(P)/FAD-dependent oxidoreductase [Pseudomaricurvus alkylphenolicus]NIB39371.1 NAD(P)/FAD-dependent oxidoreductase [Pseudomaricurvus alkylphenolicus]
MKIVIIGGGAGGLELATKLGKKLGRNGRADVLLIDRNPVHIWKPLLHEVASGSLNADIDSVSYRAHAHNYGFRFKLGCLVGVDHQRKVVELEALHDEDGEEILPRRSESYDLLVLAIGSVSNDFGVEGAAENCIFLDSPQQAERFHKRLVNRFIRLNRDLRQGHSERRLRVAIVGAGATGVELSAELFKAREWFATYGLNHIRSDHLQVSLVEAGPRVLPALSERISNAAREELTKLGVEVRTSTAVARVEADALVTKEDESIEADLIVWAAGVKAPDFLARLEGLEVNRANQLLVDDCLRVKGAEGIYALGDCAGCQITGDDGQERWVPPRAQSAHQMASRVADNIIRQHQGLQPQAFVYRDRGSLVSLSHYTAFGRLMGGLNQGSLNVEGRIARMAYVSLYRMHQLALHGWLRTLLVTLSDRINHFIRPRLKLH